MRNFANLSDSSRSKESFMLVVRLRVCADERVAIVRRRGVRR